jgi:hypothetical protein
MSIESIFKDIENAEHSTCAWFEKEYVKLHSEMPKIVAIADKILPYVSLLLQTVIGAEAGQPAATEAGVILAKAQSDLDIANAVIYDTGATPTAVSAITAVATNLKGVLTAAQISNPTSVATVTKAVSELGTLVAAFPATALAPLASGATA